MSSSDSQLPTRRRATGRQTTGRRPAREKAASQRAAPAATTGAVAALLGVHPNTLRWYEAAGYLPPVPRTPGGYRQYSGELIRLARVVRESQPLLRLYGPIRSATSAFLAACKEDCVLLQDAIREHPDSGDSGTGMTGAKRYGRSLHHLSALERLLLDEHRLALDALAALERFRCGDGAEGPGNERGAAYSLPRRGPLQYIGTAAKLTGLSRDRIINWERNGLCRYPRSAAGYRLFGMQELDRLLIIRSCRTAGYSITAIRRLLHAVTADPAETPLRTVADTPSPHETELFPVFPTDTLPATLEAMIALTVRLRDLLEK